MTAKTLMQKRYAALGPALQARYSYDPARGIFRHKKAAPPHYRAGDVAGRLISGVVKLRHEHEWIAAMRVAWLFAYGEWPGGQVGPKDGNRSNLTIENIVLVREHNAAARARTCDGCGKLFQPPREGSAQRYCSRTCIPPAVPKTPDQLRAMGRVRRLAAKYGLTVAAVEKMIEDQGGTCAICKGTSTVPVVDHCHATGKVRGILCIPCNTGLGMFGDSPARLDRAAAYLERHRST